MINVTPVAAAGACCGCAACREICPVGVVSMNQDRYGYLTASVAEERCIHCLRCVKVCPMKMLVEHKDQEMATS
ncbi:4Fe-4S dicluster domain-containing protein [Caniella muris]|uniref:4Fe-4S dicluster domain-containing protein n=1 Tax=Caniella muris TaxID=2941502 RepID=UPI003B8488E5